jgi:recombination protein RecA
MYGQGISREGELLDLAVKLQIVAKSGAWFSYGETRLGQGRDNAKEYFKTNKEIAAEIERKVLDNIDRIYVRSTAKSVAETDKTLESDSKSAVNIDITVDD